MASFLFLRDKIPFGLVYSLGRISPFSNLAFFFYFIPFFLLVRVSLWVPRSYKKACVCWLPEFGLSHLFGISWVLHKGRIQKLFNNVQDFFWLFYCLIDKLPQLDLEKWVMIAWAIWNAWNRFYFEKYILSLYMMGLSIYWRSIRGWLLHKHALNGWCINMLLMVFISLFFCTWLCMALAVFYFFVSVIAAFLDGVRVLFSLCLYTSYINKFISFI